MNSSDFSYLEEETIKWLEKNKWVVRYTASGKEFTIVTSQPYRQFLIDFLLFTDSVSYLHIDTITFSPIGEIIITIM